MAAAAAAVLGVPGAAVLRPLVVFGVEPEMCTTFAFGLNDAAASVFRPPPPPPMLPLALLPIPPPRAAACLNKFTSSGEGVSKPNRSRPAAAAAVEAAEIMPVVLEDEVAPPPVLVLVLAAPGRPSTQRPKASEEIKLLPP